MASLVPGGCDGECNVAACLLLDKARVWIPERSSATPLTIAAGRANLEVMGLLIEKKADVNARNSAGTTPLMNAASTGDPRAVRMLLQAPMPR